MDSGFHAVHNRIGDIIQKVQKTTHRFQPGMPASRPAPEAVSSQSITRPGMTAVPAGPQATQAARSGGPQFSAELEAMIASEARAQSISPDLVRAVVQAESGGKVDAKSRAGALGLMQLMPGTARELGVDPLQPQENLRGGIQYLNQMAKKFGDLDLTLAAYNAGPGAVKKYGGVPPYRETIDYIRRIRRTLGADAQQTPEP